MTFAALEQQARAALRRELDRPPQPALEPLLRTIADRYGEGLVAVLYYGSCRREDTLEGLVDFHVIVKDFSALPWGLALAARLFRRTFTILRCLRRLGPFAVNTRSSPSGNSSSAAAVFRPSLTFGRAMLSP